MSGSFESVQWNACVHSVDFSLSSERVLGRMDLETMSTVRVKIPSTKDSEEGRTHNAASHRTASPTHYQLSYSGPARYNPRCAAVKVGASPPGHHSCQQVGRAEQRRGLKNTLIMNQSILLHTLAKRWAGQGCCVA